MSIWDTWAADPRYAQVVGDPRFLAATPQYKSKIHDILFKYGFISSDPAGGTIENNPYSVAAMLKQGYGNANHSTINTVNAAGLEESGAAVGALNANSEGYKRQLSEAAAAQGSETANALADYTGQVNSIFGDIENNPIPAPAAATPAAPVYAPGTPSGTGMALPTPQGPYQRSGPEAGSVASKVKKIKPVSYADALHGRGAL